MQHDDPEVPCPCCEADEPCEVGPSGMRACVCCMNTGTVPKSWADGAKKAREELKATESEVRRVKAKYKVGDVVHVPGEGIGSVVKVFGCFIRARFERYPDDDNPGKASTVELNFRARDLETK
jgi:hypothetical protein